MYKRPSGETVDLEVIDSDTSHDWAWRLMWVIDGDSGGFFGDDHKAHTAAEIEELRMNAIGDPDFLDRWEDAQGWSLAEADTTSLKDGVGFFWGSKAKAQAIAARVMKMIKAGPAGTQKLEAWERKALDAGWKPPAGWVKASARKARENKKS